VSTQRSRRAALPLLALLGLAGCGGSTTAPAATPPAKLVRLRGSSIPSVVLSPQGMQRIGVQTARVSAVTAPAARGGPTAVVPYAAVLYEPDGSVVVYTNPSPFVYIQRPITVDHIAGERVYVTRGPAAGSRVVTVGGEELLGVQNGVGVET
jgi:hypothetical protein